jgi:pimeloyl-ACP methyl ester carboxylesterase
VPETHALEYQGCRLAFEVRGTGPPIVFIQGVGVHGRGWTPQIDDLQSRFRCLDFDNRGMGLSQPPGAPITVEQMASDALALTAHLGWDSVHLVGHSLGGPVALEMALREPSRARSLSLLCTVARGRDATRLTWRMLSIGLRSRIGPRRSRRRAFLDIVLPPGSFRADEADRIAGELAPLFGHDLADQPSIAMAQLGALRRYDATARLPQLSGIPTFVLSAEHDPIAPPRFGRALAAAIPGATFIEVAGASHGLPIQHASRVNGMLRAHLERVESTRARSGAEAP